MLNKEKLNSKSEKNAALSDSQTNKTTKFDCRGGRLCPPANKQDGITLIALIITIIVMLILVGVTVNVALNGGLFGKAKKATYQTEASKVKEQLEIAKTVAIAENNGNVVNDYSVITIDNTDLDSKIKDKYREKLIVNSNGNYAMTQHM